jgi:hypothetical protein
VEKAKFLIVDDQEFDALFGNFYKGTVYEWRILYRKAASARTSC